MNTDKKKLVVRISVGISGIVWVYLLLLYYTGLDPTDVMGYGILAFSSCCRRRLCLPHWRFPWWDSAGGGCFRFASEPRKCF